MSSPFASPISVSPAAMSVEPALDAMEQLEDFRTSSSPRKSVSELTKQLDAVLTRSARSPAVSPSVIDATRSPASSQEKLGAILSRSPSAASASSLDSVIEISSPQLSSPRASPKRSLSSGVFLSDLEASSPTSISSPQFLSSIEKVRPVSPRSMAFSLRERARMAAETASFMTHDDSKGKNELDPDIDAEQELLKHQIIVKAKLLIRDGDFIKCKYMEAVDAAGNVILVEVDTSKCSVTIDPDDAVLVSSEKANAIRVPVHAMIAKDQCHEMTNCYAFQCEGEVCTFGHDDNLRERKEVFVTVDEKTARMNSHKYPYPIVKYSAIVDGKYIADPNITRIPLLMAYEDSRKAFMETETQVQELKREADVAVMRVNQAVPRILRSLNEFEMQRKKYTPEHLIGHTPAHAENRKRYNAILQQIRVRHEKLSSLSNILDTFTAHREAIVKITQNMSELNHDLVDYLSKP